MISRRNALAMMGAAVAHAGCFGRSRVVPAPTADAATPPDLRMWDLGEQAWGRGAATVLVPRGVEEARLPLLIALHGRGEAVKPPAIGAFGWPRDYALSRAFERIVAPPLTPEDLEGVAPPAYVHDLNERLRQNPFRGLVVVCPHVPDADPTDLAMIEQYRRYMLTVVVPKARAECPVLTAPRSTGIDGVSLGGALALRIGLRSADQFGAVGALQPAIHTDHLEELTALAQRARRTNPLLALRLLTSDGDYFRQAIERTSAVWNERGVDHRFVRAPGPHDYIFNRGPGAYELLTWHDAVLSRVV